MTGVRRRLSRAAWLEAALEVLAREGEGRIRVRQLANSLGVTTGSFYAHFRDRTDFLAQILDYWLDQNTSQLARAAGAHPGPPRETLVWLARHVIENDSARYDSPVRAWATHEVGAAEALRTSDRTRLHTVRGLFQGMGFTGHELAMRTYVYVTVLGSHAPVVRGKGKARRLAEILAMIELLCRNAPAD